VAQTPRIYLDACALNRLGDPPIQRRIALEAAAMERVIPSESRIH
jgi:hypothetical protein